MGYVIAFLAILVLTLKIWNPGGYNTEIMCFDENGGLVFYEQGFAPGKPPIESLSTGVYRVKETGNKIRAECKSTWGANPPKGEDYWK
jgi:hypothetical protein